MDITKLVAGFATPMIAGKIAGALGMPEPAVRKMVAAAVPVLLAAFLKRSASPGGTEALSGALGGLSANPLEALGTTLAGDPAQAKAAAASGSNLLNTILGGGAAGTLASKLAGFAGVDSAAAGPLLGLSGAMALGGLKKTADDQGLDAAGLMRLLGSQKQSIAGAIPADLAKSLAGTDLLGSDLLQMAVPATAAAAAPRPASKPAPAPVAKKSGLMRWLVPIVALLAVLWLVSRFFGGAPETPTAVAPAEPPAAVATETAAANPLVVDGVDIGASVQGVLDQITGALGGVTDAATAQTAATTLTEAQTTLAGIEGAVGNLPAEGKSALASLIGAALPAIRATADALLADSAIGAVLRPALDGVLSRLEAMAA